MTIHMKREIEKLKKMLLALCEVVEKAFLQAVQSIKTRDAKLARKVLEADTYIDHMEVDVEEECLKMLALYQPVAIDLRFIITVLKINNDLERIGDLAVNIAERSEYLAGQQEIDVPFDLEKMAEKTQSMLRSSLQALVSMNCDLARKVCAADDEVDNMNRQMFFILQDRIRTHPEQTEPLIHLLSASRHLERVADHATNIAEDVIYMIEGQIARHRTENYTS
ncbi:MAG: phosphate signaling complex protein PhoU [Sedimentisphaerales bacterium]|jgi:phosphate transport system protein